MKKLFRSENFPIIALLILCFAIGIIKSKGVNNVAQKLRQLTRNIRLVFDYLRMTKNACIVPGLRK